MAYREFERKELGVILDALYYYCRDWQQRKENHARIREVCSRELDRYVLAAQLDERMIEARDRQSGLVELASRKAEQFEGFNETAFGLYTEILYFLENSKRDNKEE